MFLRLFQMLVLSQAIYFTIYIVVFLKEGKKNSEKILFFFIPHNSENFFYVFLTFFLKKMVTM
jgi:hypothetical protein